MDDKVIISLIQRFIRAAKQIKTDTIPEKKINKLKNHAYFLVEYIETGKGEIMEQFSLFLQPLALQGLTEVITQCTIINQLLLESPLKETHILVVCKSGEKQVDVLLINIAAGKTVWYHTFDTELPTKH